MKKLLLVITLLVAPTLVFAQVPHRIQLEQRFQLENKIRNMAVVSFVDSLGYRGGAVLDTGTNTIVGAFHYGTNQQDIQQKLDKFCQLMCYCPPKVKLTIETKEQALKPLLHRREVLAKEIEKLRAKEQELIKESFQVESNIWKIGQGK